MADRLVLVSNFKKSPTACWRNERINRASSDDTISERFLLLDKRDRRARPAPIDIESSGCSKFHRTIVPNRFHWHLINFFGDRKWTVIPILNKPFCRMD